MIDQEFIMAVLKAIVVLGLIGAGALIASAIWVMWKHNK